MTARLTVTFSHYAPPEMVGGAKRCGRRGYSLFEVMIAACLFTMVTLGVYSALIQSYKMAKLSRCRDESRAILRTYVDQFQRLETSVKVNGKDTRRWLFLPTNGTTGQGLVWGALNDQPSNNGAAAAAYLPMTLGNSTSKVNARLTRNVTYVDPSTGAPDTTPGTDSTFLLQAVFEITFELNGRTHSQRMTVMRSVP
jgi:Tfp pilus assembly protein PilV